MVPERTGDHWDAEPFRRTRDLLLVRKSESQVWSCPQFPVMYDTWLWAGAFCDWTVSNTFEKSRNITLTWPLMLRVHAHAWMTVIKWVFARKSPLGTMLLLRIERVAWEIRHICLHTLCSIIGAIKDVKDTDQQNEPFWKWLVLIVLQAVNNCTYVCWSPIARLACTIGNYVNERFKIKRPNANTTT